MATTVHQKIRIYDLAKELKLDNKKVMEDARREGIEVSVPSNTVPHEVAERIRLKYFPKKIAPKVGPRLVKHAKVVEPVEAPQEVAAPEAAPEPEVAEEPVTAFEPSAPDVHKPKVRVLKAAPKPQPQAEAQSTSETDQNEPEVPAAQTPESVVPPSIL